MVISPATVISNWEQEFHKWLSPANRPNLYCLHGRLHFFSSANMDLVTNRCITIIGKSYPTMESRLKCLEEWKTKGGVLITGYEMFRTLLFSAESAQFYQYLCDPGTAASFVHSICRYIFDM